MMTFTSQICKYIAFCEKNTNLYNIEWTNICTAELANSYFLCHNM